MPSTIRYGDGSIEYHRFGDECGIEPLVIGREFLGVRENYMEISEEFRFFHNLYHDIKSNTYLKFDDNGDESVIAMCESNCIRVRLKEILQYISIKNMHFSMQFDFRECSTLTLEELGIANGEVIEQQQDLEVWNLSYGDFALGESRAFSRLLGKRFFLPFPKEKSGAWGYVDESKKEFVDFIIALDEYGENIKHTANPELLDCAGSAQFLTAVHFKKQVLDKYYSEPSKYTITSGHLYCGTLWSMFIDNHHEDRVCVWLGDLGKSLSYSEQQHWASYNISPQGTVSDIYFKRQLMAIPTDSDQPDHTFIAKYTKLDELCENKLHWPLLLPLAGGDRYLIKEIRIPSTDEQAAFDKLIQALTKILIDSLNEQELKKYITIKDPERISGSISLFEVALKSIGVSTSGNEICFLRNLQQLRSSSVAHRKGRNYLKIARIFGIESKSLAVIASDILKDAARVLDFLIDIVERKYFETEKLGTE